MVMREYIDHPWTKRDYARHFGGSLALFDVCWRSWLKYRKVVPEATEMEEADILNFLEERASELVNDSKSQFYLYG